MGGGWCCRGDRREQHKSGSARDMSLHETPMLLRYWQKVGGTLTEEFYAVRKTPTASPRRLDGLILRGGPTIIVPPSKIDIEGRDIIVIQVKASRLGMNVMGQAFFSRELMKPFNPASIRTVVICTHDDSALRPLAEAHGIEVEIDHARG